jgi:hypothetical protein
MLSARDEQGRLAYREYRARLQQRQLAIDPTRKGCAAQLFNHR